MCGGTASPSIFRIGNRSCGVGNFFRHDVVGLGMRILRRSAHYRPAPGGFMTSLRRRLLSLLLALAFSASALGAPIRFDIPAQSLPEALRLYAHQAKMQLAYKSESINSGTSNAVVGEYDKHAALERLL